MHRLGPWGGKGHASHENVLTDGARLSEDRRRQRCGGTSERSAETTYDATKDVAFVWIFMLHAEVCEDGCLVLGYCGIVQLLNLGELVGVDEEEGGCPDQLHRFVSWTNRGERRAS